LGIAEKQRIRDLWQVPERGFDIFELWRLTFLDLILIRDICPNSLWFGYA
jgi:hypothetical protein